MRWDPRDRRVASVAIAFFLVAIGAARGGITSELVVIGGPGAFGSSGPGDPPTLSNGVPASGTILYSYDDSTGVLTLVVTNTSPVTVGVPNPLITKVFLNLPHLAVSGVALTSQVGSGGPAPAFGISVDTNLQDGTNPLGADGLGAYGVLLSTGGGVGGAIANAAADTISTPPGSYVIGPVTFTLLISGPSVGTLTASAFSNSFSSIPPGSHRANAAMKFQAGGFGSESGYISNAPGCEASGWVVGTPSIGATVNFVMSGAPGCFGCLVASLSPGPLIVGSLTIPVGMPMFPIIVEVTPPVTTIVQPLMIPNDSGLIGTIFYFAVALFITPPPTVSLGDAFQIMIVP